MRLPRPLLQQEGAPAGSGAPTLPPPGAPAPDARGHTGDTLREVEELKRRTATLERVTGVVDEEELEDENEEIPMPGEKKGDKDEEQERQAAAADQKARKASREEKREPAAKQDTEVDDWFWSR